MSFEKLIEVLGISHLELIVENLGENGSENTENQGVSDIYLSGEVPGINIQDTTGENDSTALTLDDVIVSGKTRQFVADVESVVFSSPELVWVGKVGEESTVGGVKRI